MKKRAMKKWIPKGTPYCNNCKWHKYIKTIKYHRIIIVLMQMNVKKNVGLRLIQVAMLMCIDVNI